MRDPKISVIIITYFHEKYIRQALESVISQTLFWECEVLIGDDGSRDQKVEILQLYKKQYSNIKIFAHENQGISRNVYNLFCMAKGNYIAILEGDDYWIDNKKLEKQIEQIEKNGCIAAAGNSKIVDDNGKCYGYKNKRQIDCIVGKKEVEQYQTDLFMPSAVMFRNIFLNSEDKYLVIANASRMGGNHSGIINLLGNSGMIYLSVEPYAVWRQNIVKKSTNYSSQNHDSFLDFYEALRKYIAYNNAFDLNYSKTIKQLYSNCIESLKKETKTSIGKKLYWECICYNLCKRIYRFVISCMKKQ